MIYTIDRNRDSKLHTPVYWSRDRYRPGRSGIDMAQCEWQYLETTDIWAFIFKFIQVDILLLQDNLLVDVETIIIMKDCIMTWSASYKNSVNCNKHDFGQGRYPKVFSLQWWYSSCGTRDNWQDNWHTKKTETAPHLWLVSYHPQRHITVKQTLMRPDTCFSLTDSTTIEVNKHLL